MSRIATADDVIALRGTGADPFGEPALVLRLDADPRLPQALAAARERRLIVIGLHQGGSIADADLELCDVVLSSVPGTPHAVFATEPEGEAMRVLADTARNPRAAAVLADTLRLTAALPVEDALLAESLAYSTLLAGREFARWLTERPERRPAPVDSVPVTVFREADTLRIRLNQPERRNAYSAAMRDGLVEALLLAELDKSIARIVIDAAGPVFCAGGDLAEFGSNADGADTHLLRTRAGAGTALFRLADLVSAHVHGTCVGAGIELTAFAGEVLAAAQTTFRLPEVSMGLIPGAGGTVSIPRRIGRHRTFWMAVTGTAVDTATALEWGLIDGIDAG